MSNPLSPNTGNFPLFDPAARQVLPASAAVSTAPLPRFRQRDHERSALVREILDQFNHEAERRFAAVPAPVADDQFCESICMEGSSIQRRWVKTGAFEVRQNSTSTLEPVPVLAILPEVEHVSETARSDAAAALTAMANRKPHARRGHRLPRKPEPAASWATRTEWVALAVVLGGLTIAVLASGLLHS